MADTDPGLANAVTIEAPRRNIQPADSSDAQALKESARRRIALVEGSTPHMSGETRTLLRQRLRMVAVLLLIGFSAFAVWLLIQRAMSGQWPLSGNFFIAHLVVVATLALLAWKLCAKCDLSLGALRVAEAMVFGAPALYFFILDYERLSVSAASGQHAHIAAITSGWMLLIFCHAMFIPNTWQRAALPIGLFAIAPMAINLLAYYRIPAVETLVASYPYSVFTEQALKMALAAMTGIVGVHSINALRREAFVAKQLGQYRLKKLLGSGGMGEVYLAEHQMMKRPCAIKVICPEKAGDPRVLARFEREVRATAKLSHWNTID
ncbi:MAG: serine/threonine protein kinase, partial [Pirellulales bacterium]|nr:serine/threonine protein kinase [Pirellulales bacterium]